MAKDQANKKDNKEKKDNKNFFKEFKAELKRVSWPTPKQLINNTAIVIGIVVLVAAIVFVLDVIFENINNLGVERLKAIVTSSSENTVEENTTEEGSEDQNSETAELPEGTEETTEEANVVENTVEGEVESTETNEVIENSVEEN